MELMKEAELFFLDEPTSGLDSASSLLVITFLHLLASKGVIMMLTSMMMMIYVVAVVVDYDYDNYDDDDDASCYCC